MFPGEIASDLSQYHGIRIADWHQGRMSSFELLELCEYMPDAGRLKVALLGEPEAVRQVRQIANETAVLRAGMVPGVDSEQYGSQLFFAPEKLAELVQEAEVRTDARHAVFAIGAQTGDEDEA
jgi:hypothetical protein